MHPSEQRLIKTESVRTAKRPSPPALARPAPAWADTGRRRTNSLGSYLEVPFIHKRLIFSCVLLAVALGWLLILVWPRTYASEARMIIRVGRESVSLDPTATTGSTLMLQKTQEEEIVSALEVLNSRRIAEIVVDKIGAEAILNGSLPDSEPASDQARTAGFSATAASYAKRANDLVDQGLLQAGLKDDISVRELAVRKVQKSVVNYSPRKSSVVVVETKAKSPHLAQAIAEQVTGAFVNEHLAGAYTHGSHDFFEQQSAETEVRLNELVNSRTDFLRQNKIVSIDANRDMLKELLSGVGRGLAAAMGELEQALSETEDLEEKIGVAGEEIVAEKVAATDATWSGMRQRVYELELEEQRYDARYTDENVKLKQVRQQLTGARKILAELESERVDESTTPNPVKTRLREELQRQQTRIVGLRSFIGEQEKQRLDLEKQIESLLGHERRLMQFDREIRLTENSLQSLREKLEEARVLDGLHAEKISNVHVFQPATFIERAVSPRKKPLAIGLVFLGLLSGLVLSMLRQASSPSIRTAEDVESQLAFRVIAEIPKLARMPSPRLKEQQLFRQKCHALIAEVLLSQRHSRHSRGFSLGIISVDSDAGASTLAVNLAIASSVDCRMQTVLVDADIRRRSVSDIFGLNGSPGLVELSGGGASHDECLQKAKESPLELVASAADSCEKTFMASAPEIASALRAYLEDCDLMVVDLPAASQPDQAVALAQHLDSVIVVVESEKTQIASAERLLCRLAESETRVVGVVLNKSRSYLPGVLRKFVDPAV